MSWGGRIASLFPMLYLFLVLSVIGKMFFAFRWEDFILLFSVVYLLPLFIFRLHNFFLPLTEGDFDLSKKAYNAWWTSHMLQYPFVALPLLESLLTFIPGAYSLWLRGWGSRIGHRIHWTPRTEVVDRSLIEIGDGVVVGHMTIFVSHLVENRNGYARLIIKKISVGKNSLIGAGTHLGPGAFVAEDTQVKSKSTLFWKGELK